MRYRASAWTFTCQFRLNSVTSLTYRPPRYAWSARFTSSSDTFWDLSLSRSISTKSWGWFTVKLLNSPTKRGSELPWSARFRTAPCKARRPAPRWS